MSAAASGFTDERECRSPFRQITPIAAGVHTACRALPVSQLWFDRPDPAHPGIEQDTGTCSAADHGKRKAPSHKVCNAAVDRRLLFWKLSRPATASSSAEHRDNLNAR